MAISVTAEQALFAAGNENAFTFSDARSPLGKHVAVGWDAFRIMSKDSQGAWQYRTANIGQQMTDVIYVGALGGFLAFGKGSALFVSADGDTFTQSVIPSGNWINACSGVGVILACDPSGKILRSEDGLNWVVGEAGMPLTAVGFCQSLGLFLAVGAGAQPVNPNEQAPFPPVLASVDGLNWELLA